MLTNFIGEVAEEVEVAMDDFWASMVHSSKHLSAHPSSGNQVMLDDQKVVNDDPRTYFTCPFCYVDTELSMICNHFQEEHCFDVKNAICPVCALSLGKDVVGHFKAYHANSIKAQKRSHKSGFWSFYAGRDLLGGLSAKNSSDYLNVSAPDPLLSPFFFSVQHLDSKDDQTHSQGSTSSSEVSSVPDTLSSRTLMSNHDQTASKGDSEETRQRAAFCQQLILSTIF